MPPKKLHSIRRSPSRHWVGDGFPVQTVFSYTEGGELFSPFLLLDHAGPAEFPPTEERLGVGPHPHRGFETVTIVYEGMVEHRDSSGGGGVIGPGDVQWMTAASGVVHEEFHGREYARRGGPFEMVQLWVNLPAKDKMGPPRYQGIKKSKIPSVVLPENAGSARVIAGNYAGQEGPARTFSPVQVLDLRFTRENSIHIPLVNGWTTLLFVLKGTIRVNGLQNVQPSEAAVFQKEGDALILGSTPHGAALLLSGEPLDEPITGSGPFVMNTPEEIRSAFRDYQQGRMGQL